jgi:AraC-like DNA-binding protein
MHPEHPTAVTLTPRFWRDPALPFIEARSVEDGRKVCYSMHSHEVFSIGAITSGQSTYLHEKSTHTISTGTVVLMNPGEVHACNPIEDQPWSYIMLYVDAQWLASVQQACGETQDEGLQPVAAAFSRSPELFAGLLSLYEVLTSQALSSQHKHEAALAYFTLMQRTLGTTTERVGKSNHKIERAAAYINQHFLRPIRLEEICEAASLSEAYLIRAFEQRYHMTPHAYLINRRVQHAQAQLRSGARIADIAHQTGFADQAHFQKVFKKHLAATPGQYKP